MAAPLKGKLVSFLFPEPFWSVADDKVWGPCSLEALPNLFGKCPVFMSSTPPPIRVKMVCFGVGFWLAQMAWVGCKPWAPGWMGDQQSSLLAQSGADERGPGRGWAGKTEGGDSPLTLPLLENLALRPSSAWPHHPVSFLPQIQCQAQPLNSTE